MKPIPKQRPLRVGQPAAPVFVRQCGYCRRDHYGIGACRPNSPGGAAVKPRP